MCWPGATVHFGLCQTNPIPTSGLSGSGAYLEMLRTVDHRRVTSTRTGSVTASDVTNGVIDAYSVASPGSPAQTLYLCPYHKRNSRKAPVGFHLASSTGGASAVPQAADSEVRSRVAVPSERAVYRELPKGYGEFGRVASNPLPLAASPEAILAYLLSLKADGCAPSHQVVPRERPSTTCPAVTSHPIRVYDLTPFGAAGQPIIEPTRVYVVSNFDYNTTQPPVGFHFFDTTPNYRGNTLCTRCGATVKTTAIYQYDCPRCGRLPVNTDMERRRFVANLGALSNRYWSDEQLRNLGALIASNGDLPPDVKQLQFLHFTHVISEDTRKRFEMPPERVHICRAYR